MTSDVRGQLNFLKEIEQKQEDKLMLVSDKMLQDTNKTALRAIGLRKKLSIDANTSQTRTKRVQMRDLIFYLEHNKTTNNIHLFDAYLK